MDEDVIKFKAEKFNKFALKYLDDCDYCLTFKEKNINKVCLLAEDNKMLVTKRLNKEKNDKVDDMIDGLKDFETLSEILFKYHFTPF